MAKSMRETYLPWLKPWCRLPPFATPASIGILPGVVDSVIVLPPHLDVWERRLATDNDLVAVITEGSGASYGTVPLPPGCVAGVCRLTKQDGVIMILDEVMTGFRWSLGVYRSEPGGL